MYKIGKTYHFSAAHTIPGHPKCGRMHGHNYEVTVVLAATMVDERGMITDYGVMDKVIDPIIKGLDHQYLKGRDEDDPNLPGRDVYRLSTKHSTAECIAYHLFQKIDENLFTAYVLEVMVCETDKTFATYSANGKQTAANMYRRDRGT